MSDRGGLAGGLSTGVKIAAVGLLIHQLMKYARSTQPEPAQQPAQPQPAQPRDAPQATATQARTGGGLGDVLGNLLGGGGVAAGGLLTGLGAWLEGLRSQGLGRQVDSWVSRDGNQPVAAQDLRRAFDDQELDDIARRAGTDRESLLAALSEVMPRLVDRMTPQGRVPEREEELDLTQAVRGAVGEETPTRPGRPV